MQVPARGEEVRQPRPAHERREQAAPLADLLDRGAEQHHRVRRREPSDRAEAEFHLARAPLVLHRAGRQPERSQPVLSAHGNVRNVAGSGTSTMSGNPVNSSMPKPPPAANAGTNT